MTPSHIHVGSLIRLELIRQKRSISWLANQLGVQRSNCYRIIHAETMYIDRLFQISQLLHHDFFADYSNQLKPYTGNLHTNH